MIACGNWSTFNIIDRLEQDLGKPVLTTIQVSLWHALKMMGMKMTVLNAVDQRTRSVSTANTRPRNVTTNGNTMNQMTLLRKVSRMLAVAKIS